MTETDRNLNQIEPKRSQIIRNYPRMVRNMVLTILVSAALVSAVNYIFFREIWIQSFPALENIEVSEPDFNISP